MLMLSYFALLEETINSSFRPNLLYFIHITALSNGDEAEIDMKIGTEWNYEDVSYDHKNSIEF